jgi:hypothetical protein
MNHCHFKDKSVNRAYINKWSIPPNATHNTLWRKCSSITSKQQRFKGGLFGRKSFHQHFPWHTSNAVRRCCRTAAPHLRRSILHTSCEIALQLVIGAPCRLQQNEISAGSIRKRGTQMSRDNLTA